MTTFREINHRFADNQISVEGVIVSAETDPAAARFRGGDFIRKGRRTAVGFRTELRDVAAFQERFFKIPFPAGINLSDVDQKARKFSLKRRDRRFTIPSIRHL